MSKSRGSLVAWIIGWLVLVSLGVIVCWLSRPVVSGARTVDASRLPVSVTVGDVRLTVISVRTYGTINSREVRIKMTAESLKRGLRVLPEHVYLIVNGRKVSSNSCGTEYTRDDPQLLTLEYSYMLAVRLRKLDLGFAVQSSVPGAAKKISFKRVTASSLPLTRKVGPVSVTLTRIGYSKTGGAVVQYPDKTVRYGRVTVGYIQRGPADNFRGEITIDGGRSDHECSSPAPYWYVSDSAVCDENGIALQGSSSSSGERGGAEGVFSKQAGERTPVESLVGMISGPRAADMATDRALRAAQASVRIFECETHFQSMRAPKYITWEPITHLPPTDKHRYEVVFKRIPLPAPVRP